MYVSDENRTETTITFLEVIYCFQIKRSSFCLPGHTMRPLIFCPDQAEGKKGQGGIYGGCTEFTEVM